MIDPLEDQLYRDSILEHWRSPLHAGVVAIIDREATHSNPICGDEIHVTISLQNDTISDIAFESHACAIATASASLYTDLILGMPIADVRAQSPETIFETLGIKPVPGRIPCAVLILQCVQDALRTP